MKNYLLIPGVALLLSLSAVACNWQHGQHNTVTDKATAAGSTAADRRIDRAVADPGRPAADVARDHWRNPAQTLKFFGLRPDMHVVELWPGGGWYTRILAPIVRGEGKLTAANWVAEGKPEFYAKLLDNYANLLASTDNLKRGRDQCSRPRPLSNRSGRQCRHGADFPQSAQLDEDGKFR